MILNYNNAITANFKLTFPAIKDLEFYVLSVNVPTISLNAIDVPYQDVRSKIPDNKYFWDDLSVQFILDESLLSYELLSDWIHDIRNVEFWQSALKDIVIIPLDSNKNIEYSFVVENAWPTNISGWQYASSNTTSDAIIFDVTFTFQNFYIKRLNPINFRISTAGSQ